MRGQTHPSLPAQGRLRSKHFRRPAHILHHRDPEGASLLTGPAGDALSAVVRQDGIVLPHGFRHLPLGAGQIQEFGDTGHIDATGQGAQWPQYIQWPTQLILDRAAKAAA